MTSVSIRGLTFASGELTLEGVLHVPATAPAPGVVVCHPHPLYGGSMDNNVVAAACEAMVQRGYAALRFNFRGVHGSEGEHDEGRGEADDARAALAYLRGLPEVDEGRVGLIGYSFGAMVGAEAASGAIRALAMISPPLAYADLRVGWGCPVLIMGSETDPVAPAARLRLVAEQPGVELVLVDGADHSWWGYEADLAEGLGSFFERHFQ
jgi:alpha/beta superfamily hydrolase